MEIVVPKIGDGSHTNQFRPDTTETWWEIVNETDTNFTIRICE